MLTFDEALHHPWVAARGMTVQAGERLQIACPIGMAGFDFSVARTAPRLGEHQREVPADCGYDETAARSLADGQEAGPAG